MFVRYTDSPMACILKAIRFWPCMCTCSLVERTRYYYYVAWYKLRASILRMRTRVQACCNFIGRFEDRYPGNPRLRVWLFISAVRRRWWSVWERGWFIPSFSSDQPFVWVTFVCETVLLPIIFSEINDLYLSPQWKKHGELNNIIRMILNHGMAIFCHLSIS